MFWDDIEEVIKTRAVKVLNVLSREDLLANAAALKDGTRLLSAYHLKDGTKIWIITEWDRSATTCLLPEEY